MHKLDILETIVGEGFSVPLDVAMSAMSSGYIVEGLEDRVDGFRVFDIDEIEKEIEFYYE